MFNKSSTRVPEAIYYMFRPRGDAKKAIFSKLGHPVDPYNVVLNGSQLQHGKCATL